MTSPRSLPRLLLLVLAVLPLSVAAIQAEQKPLRQLIDAELQAALKRETPGADDLQGAFLVQPRCSPHEHLSRRAILKGSLLAAADMAGEDSSPGHKSITPKAGVTPLFNGKDLTGLSTWLKDTKHKDPRKVFSVHDGKLHISGDGFGYLATDKAYRDYHLSVEYKWGKRTDGGKYVRNSGILLHGTGPAGGAGGTWMSCIECQLAQGCVGDLICIRGKDDMGKTIPVQITSDVALGPDKRPRWKKGGKPQVFTGRQLWWSLHDPEFKELLDTHGKNDVESPLGEWTRVECVCEGKRISIIVNGTKVNECYNVFPAAGKIMLQCEGFELFVRKFELRPVKKDG